MRMSIGTKASGDDQNRRLTRVYDSMLRRDYTRKRWIQGGFQYVGYREKLDVLSMARVKTAVQRDERMVLRRWMGLDRQLQIWGISFARVPRCTVDT